MLPNVLWVISIYSHVLQNNVMHGQSLINGEIGKGTFLNMPEWRVHFQICSTGIHFETCPRRYHVQICSSWVQVLTCRQKLVDVNAFPREWSIFPHLPEGIHAKTCTRRVHAKHYRAGFVLQHAWGRLHYQICLTGVHFQKCLSM